MRRTTSHSRKVHLFARNGAVRSIHLTRMVFFVLVLNLFISSGSAAVISGLGTGTVKGTLSAESETIWDDDQWQYFRTSLGLDDTLILELEYSGDLDLDLWIFVDEQSSGTDQQNYAKDLTHCPREEDPTRYSSIKTKDTSNTGPERIEYTNTDFIVNRTVYILIFVQEGVGTSEYTLTSNLPLYVVTNSELSTCWTVQQAWILFILATASVSTLIIYLAKRAARTPEQKAQIRAKKEEKKKKKKKKKKKAQSSMAARKATRRR